MKCKLLDVFTNTPLNGNGLTLFYDFQSLGDLQMMQLTQEMRQFESIFVSPVDPTTAKTEGVYSARIFTVEEELEFAGHPLIGLGAHLHEEYGEQDVHKWTIKLNNRDVELQTKVSDNYFETQMQLGKPEFIKTLPNDNAKNVLRALNLSIENTGSHPLEVISNGLPYLIVPVIDGIENAQIKHDDFEALLANYGAKFVYVLDLNTPEGRTWDNSGKIEDVATGSAAGPAAAYLWKHKLLATGEHLELSQGRFLGRPSTMALNIYEDTQGITNIELSGHRINNGSALVNESAFLRRELNEMRTV